MITRVAVIGLGNMGRHHLKHYTALPNVEVVGICDIDEARVTSYAQEYDCQGFTDINQMLETAKPEALSLISPTKLHYSMAKHLLEKGVHVLIEKPIAETPEQGQELDQLAQQKNLVLTVGHIERFNPAIQALKKWHEAGHLGQLVSIQTRRVSPMPLQIRDATVMIDLAVHDLDLICWLLGEKPKTVTGHQKQISLTDRADLAVILMDFEHAISTSEVHWLSPTKERSLIATGTKGTAKVDFSTFSLEWATHESGAFSPLPVAVQDALYLELEHFISSIQQNKAPYVTAQEAILALKLSLLSNK